MAKEQVLGFKPAPRLEQIDDEHSERVQTILSRHANPNPDGIFGKDTREPGVDYLDQYVDREAVREHDRLGAAVAAHPMPLSTTEI
jgi:hypothetical protein